MAFPCIAYATEGAPVRATEVLRVITLPTALGVLSALAGMAGRLDAPPVLDLLLTGALTTAIYLIGLVTLVALDPVHATLRRRASSWLTSRPRTGTCDG
jgi:hypothetical protein